MKPGHTQSQGIFVVTAPSGTGKTTLNRRLVHELANIEISISTTTRQPRANEIDGAHYWFVSTEEFLNQVKQGRMLEWANVHGNLYGTSKEELWRIQNKGLKVLLEIDVQGWAQLKDSLASAVSIFLLPPSLDSLWERLAHRGTDNLATRFRRIQNARKELESGQSYEYFIVNDDIEVAYSELCSIVLGHPKLRLSQEIGQKKCCQLLKDFDSSSWLAAIEAQIKQS